MIMFFYSCDFFLLFLHVLVQKISFFQICISESCNVINKNLDGGDHFRPICGLENEFGKIGNDVYMPLMQGIVDFYPQISKSIIPQMPLSQPQT